MANPSLGSSSKIYMKTSQSGGLTTQPKLRYEHVYLNNFSKMRVDLASQVINYNSINVMS